MSVFTHLTEETQFEWLAELQRISAPGAVLLMSVHGGAAVARRQPSEEWFDSWMQRGFDAEAVSDVFRGVIDDDNYYRSAYHTQRYIRERWSEFFEVSEIIPAFMSNTQDLIVLRNRL